MTRKKPEQYDVSLKRQIAEDVLKAGHRQCDIARQYDISEKLVSRWVSDYKAGISWARSGDQIAQDEEFRRLQKENKRLYQEVEILKKASAYFAKNQK